MFTTLLATFLTTGATLVAALRSRLMGVSWMFNLGAGFGLAASGAAPFSKAAWRTIKTVRLLSAAVRLGQKIRGILFMSFSCSTILHCGVQGDLAYDSRRGT